MCTSEFDSHSSKNELVIFICCKGNIVVTNFVYSPPITNDSTHPRALATQPFTPHLMTSFVCSYALIMLSHSTPATPINITEQFACNTAWKVWSPFQRLRYILYCCKIQYIPLYQVLLWLKYSNTSLSDIHVPLPSLISFSNNLPQTMW